MTDRELLETAAKAAGLNYRDDLWNAGHVHTDFGWRGWNPLTSDGDALRLAVALRIDLSLWINLNTVTAKTHIGAGRGISLVAANSRPVNDQVEPRGADPYAATRRAIVRAAAEIGRSMT